MSQELETNEPTMMLCQTKRLFRIDGKKEYRWIETRVSDIPPKAEVRCLYCKGAVRIQLKRETQGEKYHCEHRRPQDSVYCKAGCRFEGEHRDSMNPVE